MESLQPVDTLFVTYNANVNGWNQPFNKCAFINNDANNSVFINGIEVASNKQMIIALNVGEFNTTDYVIDFKGSATAALLIMYTRYHQVRSNQWKY